MDTDSELFASNILGAGETPDVIITTGAGVTVPTVFSQKNYWGQK